MKLVMTLLVRDEEEILEANLEHHFAQGVDFVIATDNGSVDGTVAILERYERAGRLALLHEPGIDRSQHRWVTTMARSAARDHGADWIFHDDADEFWFAVGEPDLRSVFESFDDGCGALQATRFNVVARPIDERPFWERLDVRRSRSVNEFTNPLQPKVAHRADPDVAVLQGNHEIVSDTLGAAVSTDALEILHFPQISWPRFETKVKHGGVAYTANPDLPAGIGRRYRTWYAMWQSGELDAEWARLELDDDEIEAGLLSGDLVRDARLAASLEGTMLR